MTPETPSLTKTPLTDAAEARYFCWKADLQSPDAETVLAAMNQALEIPDGFDFARTLETRAISAEADNARMRGVLERCREAMQNLYDHQNGAPLYKLEEGWSLAMGQTKAALQEAAAILSKP